MGSSDLTFTEFMDLLLARLAEADLQHPGMWVDMFPLAEELRQNVPEGWVFDAREALERRGWVNPLKVLGRTAPARLTGEGRLYVERGGDTGVIGEYHRRPSNFVIVSGPNNQVAVGVEGDVTQTSAAAVVPPEAWQLLDQIEGAIEEESSLTESQRSEAVEDVQAARAQLQRPKPNTRAALALLDPLAKLATVGAFVGKLISLLS